MPDPKKSSSIFNFSASQLRLLKYTGIFFAPVLLIVFLLEMLIVDLPSEYKIVGDFLEDQSDEIEVAVFGSSQIKNSVNPQFIDKNTLNISSSAQHHNTDFSLLKGLTDRLPNLKTVVFEVSYGHFEIPHNSKFYWKHSVFLKYYGINTFDRTTVPTDKLLYISHPGYFSTQLVDYYIRDSIPYKYNRWGFDLNNYKGKFKKLNYDIAAIDSSYVKMNRRESVQVLNYNLDYFYKMLEFCEERGLDVVLISPPTFTNYNSLRNKEMLARRDSIIGDLKTKYANMRWLNAETDTIFKVTDFRNENHLNPDGAKKFTLQLNEVLNKY